MLAAPASRRTLSFLGFFADPRRTSRLVVLVLLISLAATVIYRSTLQPTAAGLPGSGAGAVPGGASGSAGTPGVGAAATIGSQSKEFYFKLLKDKTKGELMGEWDTDLLVPLLAAFYTHQRLNKIIGKGNIFIDIGANTGWCVFLDHEPRLYWLLCS